MVDLGVTWAQAGSVVISTIGIYVTFLLLIRVAGQRTLANMSSFDFAAAVALGAVMGRSVLGYTPTLLAGVIALTTLFALQALFGLIRRSPRADAASTNQPMLLMADGQLLMDNMRRAHVVENELRAKLRDAGIRSYDEVGCVILERTGSVSVLRRGEPISAELLLDVRGREALNPNQL